MEEHFLKAQLETEAGKLLLQSTWKQSSTQNHIPVQLHERCVKVGQQYLPFSFDLRFMISEDTLTFYISQHEQSYELVNKDASDWKSNLKKYLNQVGFHQQFKPMKKIGRGNFATVYMVERIEDKSKYAVKAFSKEAAYSEQNGKECLIKEIEIIRRLNNSHNMKLCEVFESEHSLYIVFQLLDGGQLYEKIKAKEKFKIHQIKKMMVGMLEGLKEMHSKNIMHRDLKPENILFRSKDSYECVIADYGLAQFSDLDDYLFVRCGTPGYVAPQVINIKDMKTRYSPICDIFSLGLIFHLLLFGKSVFKGKTYNQVLQQNRSCNFDLESQEYRKVDTIVMDLLKKMLKTNPEERITAQTALIHPFFGDYEEKVEPEEQEEQLEETKDIVSVGQSPLLTTANDARKKEKNLKRDSCLSFKMAKDNVFTGKTETVGSLGSNKISGFGTGLLKGLKPSKFVKPEEKQNTAN